MTHPLLRIVLLSLALAVAPLEGFAARAKPPAAKAHAPVAAKKKIARTAKPAARKKVAKASQPARKKHVVAKRTARAQVARVLPPLPADADKLPLMATVAYVIDQDSGEVLLGKNDEDVRPIASLTKLMTGLIVADAQLPMDERIAIADEDVDRLKFSSSRLRVGTTLTRSEALRLTLMSSENRAAHALARTYPGGTSAFVAAMNNRARELGMRHTHYVDASGLSSDNRSSARDLALLAGAAHGHAVLRRYSTSPGYRLDAARGNLQYVNSNRLVREGGWPIGLQKTGYISEAGQCLVVQARLQDRNVIMVFLDSATKLSRIRDAELVRRWLREHPQVES